MDVFLVQFINLLVTVLYIAILARVILSWLPMGQNSNFAPIMRLIYQITEPVLGPIRRILPSIGMLDLSPMVAIILLSVIQRVVISAL